MIVIADLKTVERIKSSSELLRPEFLLQTAKITDEELKMKTLSMALQKAQALGCETEFKQCMIAMQNLYEVSRLGTGEEELSLDRSSDGRVLSTIDNYVKIFEGDEEFKFLRFNSLSRSAETLCDGKTVKWTDTHDSQAKNYFEKNYGICAEAKYENALRIILSKRSYHPVRELIESIEWDGESRIYTFLTKCMRAEDTPYTREVSRLIFAGGIHRLYNPGCKFDDMPVLIGTRQGEGKSTIVRWLALKDEFFTEVNEFEGQRGIESLEGAWICEVSELLALTKTKEQEAVKSYLSRLNDRYRMPFDKRVTDHPRQCVFIGTTNKEQFLTDKTGNRRYYPVRVYQSAHNLYEHEKEIKEYILQCWAEASFLYSKGELKPYADPDMEELIREKQSEAVQDDYRVGMIRDYLETKNEVCIPMLWYEALKMRSDIKPTRKDSCDIALIMQGMVGWEKKNNTHFFKDYGSQRWWKKEWIEL